MKRSIILAVFALLAAACSSNGSPDSPSDSPSVGGSSSSPSAVAFSACMRSHGVANYPDPDTSGQLPKTDAHVLGVSTSRYVAAQQACRHLLRTGGSLQQLEQNCMEDSDCTPTMVQQMLAAGRKLARCMRSHGVSNFPDPSTDSHGPVFNISEAGISDAESHTREFIVKLDECARIAGDNAPESFE